MKKFRQLISLLLFVAIFTASCANNTPPPTETNDNTSTSDEVTTEDPNDANGFLKDNLPDDLDFDGKTITILGWNHYEDVEFDVNEETGDIVNDALFKRNQDVEERLNVELEFIIETARGPSSDTYMPTLRNSVMSSAGEYDITAVHSHRAALAAQSGYLTNLLNIDYLDLEAPWWRKSLIDEVTINDALYFSAGDISISALSRMQGIFVNMDLIEDNGYENPYELVVNGKWTYDKLDEMISGLYSDLNGNQKKDEGDMFGFCSDQVQLQATFFSAGLKFVEHDESGSLVISPLLSSDRSINLLERLTKMLHSTNDSIRIQQIDDDKIFREGRSMFYAFPLGLISSTLRDVTFGVGFIPFPKFEESDENYLTSCSNAFSMWGIPLDASEPDTSGAVMEAMASAGYRTVTPALFETAYKVKYNTSDSLYQGEVFDMMRDNMVYDIGKIFASVLSFNIDRYTDAIVGNNLNWASTVESNRASFQAKLDELEEQFKEFSGQ